MAGDEGRNAAASPPNEGDAVGDERGGDDRLEGMVDVHVLTLRRREKGEGRREEGRGDGMGWGDASKRKGTEGEEGGGEVNGIPS